MSADRGHDASALNKRVRIAAAVVGLVLACLLGWRVVRVADSDACSSCHSSPAFRAGSEASAHAAVPCQDCHAPVGATGRALFAVRWSLHDYAPRSRTAAREAAAVPDTRCLACHAGILERVSDMNGLRIDHEACTAEDACTDCHASTAHGAAVKWARSYNMDACLECHVASNNAACDLCHAKRTVAERPQSRLFAISHVGDSRHGTGSAKTCTACHAVDECNRCHGAGIPHEDAFLNVHATYATRADAQCESCHKRTFCDSCHGIAMPHPASFTPRHSAAAQSTPKLCDRCHAASDCSDCHVMHVHPGGAGGMPGEGG